MRGPRPAARGFRLRGVIRALGMCLLPVLAARGGAADPLSGPLPLSHADITAAQLKEAIASSKGNPIVLNVWATWCIPCRKEFPHLVALEKEFRARGVRFLSVSVDTAAAYASHAKPFLAELQAPFPAWRKTDGDDEAFINALDSRWQGDLPAVFLFTREGGLLKRLTGEQTLDDLRREISALVP